MKKMTINELRGFIFENYYKRISFLEKIVFVQRKSEKKIGKSLQLNQQKKIPDPRKAKEHYQSFLRKKSTRTSHKFALIKVDVVLRRAFDCSIFKK